MLYSPKFKGEISQHKSCDNGVSCYDIFFYILLDSLQSTQIHRIISKCDDITI